jgi:hypothetical protein
MTRTRMIFCLFTTLFFLQPLVADGFLAGTLVKTPTGFLPIEQLRLNDEVFCFDLANTYTTRPIIHITTGVTDHYVQLCIDGTYLNVAPDQLLYLPQEERWIKAEQLTTDHVLLAYDMRHIDIESVELISATAEVHKVTVSECHNLCVSPQAIIAHNFFPLIGAGVWLTFGAGAVQWGMGLVAGIGMLGSVLGLTLSKNSDDKKGGFTITPTANEGDSINISTPGGFPQGPNKRNNDDEDEHPHGKYEDADYHHKNSHGNKSACPKNGQKALDNSIQIKDTSPHRVGISEGEIVILKQTAIGKFHGYVSTWKELVQGGKTTQAIRNALTDSGLVSQAGKILKSML